MGDIPDSIVNLSNTELRKELIKVGIQPAPLTPTTRRLYQRKLAQKIVPCSSDIALELSTNKNQSSSFNSSVETLKPPVSSGEKGKENSSPPPDGVYHAVHFPRDISSCSVVFNDKQSALKVLSKSKDARYKQFTNPVDADAFAKDGECSAESPNTTNNISEKANNFSAPKQVDLNKLMQAIESNNMELFQSLVWNNPRYLISSGDGPVLLKPSTRYNALHVAARSDRPEMIRKIIEILKNDEFQHLMYARDSPQTHEYDTNRVEHIVDLYLNTPEKGFYETPLHLSCKLGFVEVVSELISHPQCSRSMKNKYGQTPSDVVCTRCKNLNRKSEILSLLEEQFYIPLVRSHDNSKPPTVGQLWTPSGGSSGESTELPHASNDPTAPISVVSALAGPMSRDEAREMQHIWATPDKRGFQGRRVVNIRRSDIDRGDERIGRELAKKADIQWLEYWSFLNNYVDFTTDDGMNQLEDYFVTKLTQRGIIQVKSSHDEVTLKDDSLSDLCNKMNEMELKGNSKTPNKDTNCPNEWWISSTPTRFMKKSTSNHERSSGVKTPQERRIDSIRNDLLKIRQKRLSRVSESADAFSSLPQARNPSQTNGTSAMIKKLSSDFEDTFAIKQINKGGIPRPELHSDDVDVSADHETSLTSESGDVFTPEKSPSKHESIFISGSCPSKIDRDVLLAISDTEVSSAKYPQVLEWMRSVMSYSNEDRQKWRTPAPPSGNNRNYPAYTNKGTPLKLAWPASPMLSTRTPPKFTTENCLNLLNNDNG